MSLDLFYLVEDSDSISQTSMALFKLIDENQKEDIIKNERISLSRPLFEFGSPEGIVIDFFRDIVKLYKANKNINSISPTEDIIRQIHEWCSGYHGSAYNFEYSLDYIFSDFKIIITRYFLTYCGYFTGTDLDSRKNLYKYLRENDRFIKNNKKCYVLKVDFDDREYTIWNASKKDDGSLIFDLNEFNEEAKNKINGYLRVCNVEYLPNTLTFLDIFNKFNKSDGRRTSSLFKYTKEYLSTQNEMRLIFALNSDRPNSTLAAYSFTTQNLRNNTIEERLFRYALNVAKAIDDNLPEYIYLKIKSFEILSFDGGLLYEK